jgi:hypothetical protein
MFIIRVTIQGRQRLHISGEVENTVIHLNELVIHEIRNNAPAIFQNFLFICCKI